MMSSFCIPTCKHHLETLVKQKQIARVQVIGTNGGIRYRLTTGGSSHLMNNGIVTKHQGQGDRKPLKRNHSCCRLVGRGMRRLTLALADQMNEDQKTLIAKHFKNTPMGFIRIKRNLELNRKTDEETERILGEIISATPLDEIITRGKNHYFNCVKLNAILTINKSSLTIITAKQITNTANQRVELN